MQEGCRVWGVDHQRMLHVQLPSGAIHLRGSVSGIRCSGFKRRVQGFGVRGSGSGVRGSGSEVRGSGFGVRGLGFGVWGSGFGFQAPGFGIRDSGLSGFEIWGLEIEIRVNNLDEKEACGVGVEGGV